MSHRWFVLPLAEVEQTDSDGNVISTHTAPKYTSQDAINGFSGTIVDFVAPEWDGLSYPFIGERRYVVKLYGTDSTLDSVASHSDAHTMGTLDMSEGEVASMLNQRFGQQRLFDEWESAFRVGE